MTLEQMVQERLPVRFLGAPIASIRWSGSADVIEVFVAGAEPIRITGMELCANKILPSTAKRYPRHSGASKASPPKAAP